MDLRKNINTAFQIVALPWLVYFLNIVLPIDLRTYGIRPRNVEGLWGIVFSPLLHGGLSHLIANTGALFILLIVSLSYSRRLTYRALLIIITGGGTLVWILGQSNSLHIGASGIVFGLIGFLIFLGICRREWKALIVSLSIGFVYGGTLLSLLVPTPGISWSGHFFGFLTGVMAASWMRKKGVE